MSNAIISVENLSKVYRIDVDRPASQPAGRGKNYLDFLRRPLYQLLHGAGHSYQNEEFWALRDVSFDLKQGEVLGIIGRNGAGKSTLLKILSRITYPTSGRIQMRGRVASLLEVGTGFHPELTGRENVFLNGAILGMRKSDMLRHFDDIVSFAELAKFIDMPVKRYSSGMRVRLAFAVAAHLEPEILLIDEVLAVGDVRFQERCMGKMNEASTSGRTILFVSHQMSAVKTLCSRAIYLDNGSIQIQGDVNDVVSHYLAEMVEHTDQPLAERMDRSGNGLLRFTKVRFLDFKGAEVSSTTSTSELTIEVHCHAREQVDLSRMIIAVSLRDEYHNPIVVFSTEEMGPLKEFLSGDGVLRIQIPNMLLRAGNYGIKLWAGSRKSGVAQPSDCVECAAEIQILPGDFWKVGTANRGGNYCVVPASMQLER